MELILLIIISILFIRFIIKKSFVPLFKGAIGEYFVKRELKKLNSHEYTCFHNFKINIKGKTSQIDHLVISNYGIFVIETKYYKGWIFGSESNKYWTQVIYKNKFRLYNPIRQNRGHIYALQFLLKQYKNLFYISIVVFSSKAKLKTKTNTKVIYINQLNREIKKYQKKIIADKVKNDIIEIVRASQNPKIKTKQQVEKIDAKVNTMCPKCGGHLMRKIGKFGRFKGCSNFPNCRYTKSIRQ